MTWSFVVSIPQAQALFMGINIKNLENDKICPPSSGVTRFVMLETGGPAVEGQEATQFFFIEKWTSHKFSQI